MSKHVLLVEDDTMLRQLYTDILTVSDIALDVAKDGDEAFQKMHIGGYDLVLLDMMLPGMTGLEVVKKLQTDKPEKVNKKVIFMTNTDNKHDLDEIKTHSDGFLIKSDYTPDMLLEKVKGFIKD